MPNVWNVAEPLQRGDSKTVQQVHNHYQAT